MPAQMNKNERVEAALLGNPVDRVPVSAWWHDFAREWSAQGLAAAAIEAYREYDWDFIKLNPRASYYAEPLGARFQRHEDRQPDLVHPGITSVEDLRRVEPGDVAKGPYGEQLDALRLVVDALDGQAPVVQTVFSPLAVVSRTTGSTGFVRRLMRESADELLGALGAITETLRAYARACLDAGAAGIFFATVEWGSADNISSADCDRFARPFDLQVLETVQGAPFNVLHVCRSNNHVMRLLDYPVAAFHWDARASGNPALTAVAGATDRAVMGGVDHEGTMKSGSPAEVVKEAQRAVIDTGARRFLLAPGCSIDPGTPEKNRRALMAGARL